MSLPTLLQSTGWNKITIEKNGINCCGNISMLDMKILMRAERSSWFELLNYWATPEYRGWSWQAFNIRIKCIFAAEYPIMFKLCEDLHTKEAVHETIIFFSKLIWQSCMVNRTFIHLHLRLSPWIGKRTSTARSGIDTFTFNVISHLSDPLISHGIPSLRLSNRCPILDKRLPCV